MKNVNINWREIVKKDKGIVTSYEWSRILNANKSNKTNVISIIPKYYKRDVLGFPVDLKLKKMIEKFIKNIELRKLNEAENVLVSIDVRLNKLLKKLTNGN